MICKKCGKTLNFDEAELKQFVACPYCGSFLPKVVSPIEPGTAEAELKRIVDDFGGLQIFSEENATRFAKALMTLSSPFDVVRDKLFVASIKNVPQRLYSVLNKPILEQQQMVNFCLDELTGFDLPEKFAKEIVSWLVKVMQMPVIVECVPQIEKVVADKVIEICYKQSSYLYKQERRQLQYRTCIIGNQEWLAENFHEERGNNNTIGRPCSREDFGRMYDWNEAARNVPEGWRLPLIEDFQDLAVYIKSLGYEPGTSLKSTTQWHGEADQGLDLFGFCAYPTERNPETGESQVWFWTSSESKKDDCPYCIGLRANSNDIDFQSRSVTGFYACVRYVRNVK
ncbi:MAG: hypothetical protein IJ905_18000 [Fibrobacter sp.]|jgi:uncharacterized protein (TIGR02145 family)|nr:hypothetical protein [Fibrobacter sp.]